MMGLFAQLSGRNQLKDTPILLAAIERAINGVEPLLKQVNGYQRSFRKSVATALEYANGLSERVPGPVVLNRETYAKDPFVHALFPSVDYVMDAFCTSMAVRDYYRNFPDTGELFAMMGMRRVEKNIIGVELSDKMLQLDVMQKAVYFTSHTIEYLAPTEKQSREMIALSLFDSLVGKVKIRAVARQQNKQLLLKEKNVLASRLRTANVLTRPALQEQLSRLIEKLQTTAGALDMKSYIEDFEAVMLHPEKHLQINQIPVTLDRMGISRENGNSSDNDIVLFSDIVDFDRRNWTVTMVHCSHMQNEGIADNLEKAYRKLVI